MSEILVEEYKQEFPDDTDPNTRSAFQSGFRSFKSDSLDYLLEHHEAYPLTLVLFYDSRDYDEGIMRYLTIRLLEKYVTKKDKLL